MVVIFFPECFTIFSTIFLSKLFPLITMILGRVVPDIRKNRKYRFFVKKNIEIFSFQQKAISLLFYT